MNITTKLAPPLFVLLLSLKLAGVIAWPWLVVTAPLWAPLLVALALVGAGAGRRA